jgi:ABC-type spermidine/putrescine transport system permease subunit II
MIFKKNNLNIGLGMGMLLPMAFFGVLYGCVSLFHWSFKTRTIALIGICANIILMQAYRKVRANESIRGIVLATVGMAVIWFIYFGEEILSEYEY